MGEDMESDAAPANNLRAKMPMCVEMMYVEVKSTTLKKQMKIVPHHQDPNYEFVHDINLSEGSKDYAIVTSIDSKSSR